ncbi:hypothetical protein FBEOM_8830 [Fusarium beomiforme]|uniref:Uncharacterized protein n=1 Tax=Fusarium beomiforme TaxID=44412 RepID=A0A9P5DTY2_9HYPO|nr:hypothetical protein FBEOM_8830 [Fusarium beomiforme]
MELQTRTNQIVCTPAPTLGSAIAAIIYRKLRPRHEKFSEIHEENKALVNFFGWFNGVQWLPIAIQVWKRTRGQPFIIELDESFERPVAKGRGVGDDSYWVVKTRMPDMNKYENTFRNVFDPEGEDLGYMMPKLEIYDEALISIEESDTEILSSPSLNPQNDDREMDGNAISLLD